MTTPNKPAKPSPDFPLFAHASGQWARKVNGKTVYFGKWSDPAAALAKYQGQATTEKIPRKANGEKPSRPAGFPLFPHQSGSWAKKVRGKTIYFGPWSDPDGALRAWNDRKEELLSGRKPKQSSKLTLRELVNRFLTSKRRKVEAGELEERTWQDYDGVCGRVLEVLGKETRVEDLEASDFDRLRAALVKGKNRTLGPVSVSGLVGRTRAIFNFATKNGMVKTIIPFGDFRKPSKSILRKARNKKGPRMFTAKEIRLTLRKASPQLKAMILLGVNAGLGNADCARLTTKHIKGMWLNYARPKTGIDRRCPLWPETRKAIEAALAVRPKAKDSANADRVFITRCGKPWEPKSKSGGDSPVTKEMAKLLKELGIKRPGLSFYTLRHVCQTIGEQTLDKDAVRLIMGHAEAADMSATYSELQVPDSRLLAVAKHIRKWLFSNTQSRQGRKSGAPDVRPADRRPASAEKPQAPQAKS